MTTRLDRLLLILDSGTSAVTRNAAAKQLGEVQQLHPHELPNLLSRVHVYLKSKNWDTRVAAAQAIEAIASNVPAWNPDGVKECDDEPSCEQQQKLNFEEFDIAVVLEKGEKLLGSAGDEYDAEEEIEGLSDAEVAAFQRNALCKRLGLDLGGGMDLGMGKLIDDADLISRKPKLSTKQPSVESAADVVASQIAAISSDGQMSSRQKNRAIRVAKNLAKQRSRDLERGGSFEEPAEKRQRRTQSVLVEQPSEDKVLIDNVADNASTLDEMEEWPFEHFCTELSLDIFNPTWEVRHGASSALREIVKLHGAGAGKSKSTPVTKMIEVNTAWLEDTALKLMCVFALDRFGDFVSDEVVAPVHETCAQTLGSILHHMPEQSVRKVLSILIKLQENEEWQVRRGGLLGLKYMLAVRKDMALELLPQVFPWVLKGLQDGDDDVRAVSAAALLPVAELLGTSFPQQVPSVLGILWDALLELDDLTASTNSVMSLLATLVQVDFCQPPDQQHAGLSELVPRLFPFFRHTISSVRQSALNTLNIILQHSKGAAWIEGILKTLMRELFQRVVIEPLDKIRDAALQIWSLALQHSPAHVLDYCTSLYSPVWLRLLVHPPHSYVDPNLLTYDGVHAADKSNGAGCYYYIGSINSSMTATEKDNVVISARIATASCLGGLLSAMERQQCTNTVHLLSSLQSLLFSTAATQRLCAAFVFHAWSNANKVKMEQNQQSTTVEQQKLAASKQQLISTLQNALQQQIVYEELMLHHQRLQADTQTLVYFFAEYEIDISCAIPMGSFNIDLSNEIATTKFNEESPKLPPKALKTAQAKQSLLLATISTLKTEYMKWHTRIQSCIAASLISFNQLTAKLNPVIRPVMDSIKREDDPRLRKRTSVALAQLLALCVSRQPCPNTKILKNLCMLACSDTARSPPLVFDDMASATAEETDITCKKTSGIFTLHHRRKMAAKESETRGRGRISRTNSQKDLPASTNSTEEIEQSNNETQCEGAVTALTTCVKETADCLPQVLPFLWQTTFQVVSGCTSKCGDEEQMTQLNSSLQILEYIAPHLHPTLKQHLVNILPNLRYCLDYPYTTIRHRASKCFGVLSQVITSQTMEVVLRDVLEMLSQSENETGRQGAIETVINTIEGLGLDVLPYVVLLLGPVLARMSDHLKDVRLLATNCFALLVQLIPLESGVSDPVGLSDDLKSKKLTERRFLEQLLDGTKLDQYTIPIPIDCQLRKYQQDGVNWLAFLKKYSLHGILCDDMGLGKTLQSICIIAADYHNSLKKFKISCKVEHKPLPSLVVCPTTLTGHWCYEVQKFCEKQHLNPLQYIGTPNDRQRLQRCLKDHNLVVSSYDIVRNDADFFLGQHWNYCILDEGHVIKNSKTKLSKTIKLLKAQHRLILSGTPIQNNVIELWSLFDFLMPGYLGTEKEFSAKFARPILQSKDAKSSSKEQEAGAMAMESLHKQTLPFLLRRVKEDVLQDLPPKIIQDYYCELSPLQVKLYEDFSQTKARKNVDGVIGDDKKDVKQGAGHIFQALQYLRKVCNHPSLVISPSHPEYNTICGGGTINLNDIKHSAKLVALRQLLLDCGIGKEEEDEISVVSQHRALIFCQMRSMLNIVENDLLKAHMPNVTYTRLDGSVPANQRHNIVQKFNNDPSIDVLLLTTHIGGLGLNLTGADTVIFVEHDWNPMKDLQAMDRAHRIGQKKVVNVYRLIARSTLEEKIMGLQKFKLNIANTVITKDNSSLYSMDTSQLLDLFTVDKKKEKAERSADNKKVTMKALLEEVGELWDEKQYEEEYDMESFMQSLAK